MGQIDYMRDSINTTRLYMGFIVASVLAIGGGVGSLYSSDKINSAFWIGIVLIIVFSVVFIFLAKSLHKKTEKLIDLKD